MEGGLDKMLEVVAGAPDPAASHAFLLVVSGAEPGRLFMIDRPEMIIGRSRFADISISQRALSQQHCKIVRHGENHRLFDLGSTNGTFVNNARIQQVDLRPGDTIKTGETLFTYMSGRASEQAGHTLDLPGGYGGANLRGVPDAPPVTAMAPYAAPPHPPRGGPVAHPGNPPLAQMRSAGYAGVPQVITADADADADLVTWLIRGIEFLKRYWLSIMLLGAIGCGVGIASYKFRKPPALAEFELSLVPIAADNMVEQGRRQAFGFFRDAESNFRRPALIAEVLQQRGETDVTEGRIRAVQAGLTLQKVGQYSYKGGFIAGTPEDAVSYLDIHLKLYKESEIDKALRVLTVEAETLEQQVAETEEQLNATDEALLAFKQENLQGLPEQAGERYRQLIELGSRKTELSSELTKAQNDLALARKQLKREDPEIEARIEEARPFAAGITALKRKIASMQAKGKGEQHPDMVEAREELATLESLRDQTLKHGTTKIVKSRNPVYKSFRLAVDEAETKYKNAMAELGGVTKDLNRTEELVEKLPRLQAEYSELLRSYDVTESTHAELFKQLKAVRVRLDLERAQAAARYDIVTPPNVRPVSKIFTVLTRAGMGFFAGLVFGIGLGVLRDLRRVINRRIAAARAR